jgi:hypothetical protein
MDNELDNEVPEITAANPNGGAERLDADPVTQDIHNHLDSLLDEAESETNNEPNTENESTNNQDPTPPVHALADQDPNPPVSPDAAPDFEDQSGNGNPSPIGTERAEIDPEIAAIEQPRNLSEKNQNNWRKLQETATQYKKQAEEAEVLRQRLAETNSQTAPTPPDYEELKKFKAIIDFKNDPTFISKYEEPLKNAKETIYSVMKKNGATDELIESIEKAGGPDKIDQNWWKENAIDKLPMLDADDLKDNLKSINKLKIEQEKEISYAAENAEQILEERKNQNINWYKQENEGIQKHIDGITKDIPWARYQQAEPNATPEQIQKIQEHNAMVTDLHSKFNTALWPQNAEERASVAAAAVLSHKLADQLRLEQGQRETAMQQIKRLTDENNRLKGAGKVPKTNVNTPAQTKPDANARLKMNPMDAIEMGLDEAGA